MTTQNQIVPGRDNPVVLIFTGVDLTAYASVEAIFGEDSRNTDDDPGDVIVRSETRLDLKFGDTTETGSQFWTVVGYDAENPNGIELTSLCLNNLASTKVCA